MKAFEEPLLSMPIFQDALSDLRKEQGPVAFTGCVESQKIHMINQAGERFTRLLVTSDEGKSRSLYEDFRFFSKQVYLFTGKDLLFFQADIKNNVIQRERMKIYRLLHENREKKEPITIITSFSAMMNRLPEFSKFERQLIHLEEGLTVETEALIFRLVQNGYERVGKVEKPGEFSFHGGILDLFDFTEEMPFRIEFWDMEIDTIRYFSPESQLSISRISELTIYPAVEVFLSEKELETGKERIEKEYKERIEQLKEENDLDGMGALQFAYREIMEELEEKHFRGRTESMLPYFYERMSSFLEYCPEDCRIFLEEPARLEERGNFDEQEFMESFKERLKKGLVFSKQGEILQSVSATFQMLNTGRTMILTGLNLPFSVFKVKKIYPIDCQSVVSYQGNKDGLIKDLHMYGKKAYKVAFLIPSRTRALRMFEELQELGLHAYYSEEEDREIRPGEILLTKGNLHKGFVYPGARFIVLTESDIFGSEKKKRKKKKPLYDGTKIRSFSELSIGDYVVHEKYGIGIYKGITSIETEGIVRDYMVISYLKSGTLYVPVTSLDVVQKYAGKDASAPKINRLDSPEWGRTKSRVKKAINEVAEELVELYAKRQNGKGFVYGKDTVWQQEIEELFPYEETEDQLEAIQEIKQDMEAGKIMDRLLCGDVGFGKTEVAFRSAFKAVQEDKQVVYLVPTTILAEQHYKTFLSRLQDYPVTVEMLSRFRTPLQQKKTIEGLKKGSVDIVIGTHRLLSKDVEFKDLGLLIIDEEQRFGVKHKEKIKQMKENVNVLSLTATPIPRTLHMSMIGVRDMSVLSCPPVDRLPIQTYVMEYSEELVREAISRELLRDGQVYYIYNRVLDIQEVTAKIQALVPDATVAFAHGKMSQRELEKTMLAFIEGEIDVLVSTTIVETGLDIPNVNTIIVHDAERYGLSQLYQLRGRVGRSNRQAYAFIMYRRNSVVNENAEKRLESIREFTDLGSGVKIAMQDLEIRGAGALLGEAQSGHMAEVGYDLYCKLLSEAVKQKKGELDVTADLPFDTLMELQVDAYIPDAYVGNESTKLELYKKISLLQTEEEKEEIKEELIDRFGDLPKQVENLVEVSFLREEAKKAYITEIKGDGKRLRFTFFPEAKVKTEHIPVLLTEMKGEMRIIPGTTPALIWEQQNPGGGEKIPVLKRVSELLNSIKQLLI